jgi:hypothetical protein
VKGSPIKLRAGGGQRGAAALVDGGGWRRGGRGANAIAPPLLTLIGMQRWPGGCRW